MEKTIKLCGRIDSSNVAEIEKNINEEISSFDGELILDASELEYISSAGLRIILHLKQQNDSTKVINCNPDVYDIFDVTGFSQMMDIEKAYRKLSVEGCEKIGEGAYGIVYRTDPDTIVKVYKNPDSINEIQNERELARKAFVLGIPTAISYDIVQVGNLYGTVFEMLNAKSFAELIKEGTSLDELVKESVKILKIIHSTKVKPGELPSKKEEVIGWAEYCLPYLPNEIGIKLMNLIKDIEETNTVIHGDYHVKNIMKQNGENLLIDMETLAMGHPIFELAGLFTIYEGFTCFDKKNPENFLGIPTKQCEEFCELTFNYYFENESKEYIEKVRKMAEVICYTRLLRRQIKHYGLQDEKASPSIEFCKNYLIENVAKMDSLSF